MRATVRLQCVQSANKHGWEKAFRGLSSSLAANLLNLAFKYSLLMLLWQQCPRTTRFSGPAPGILMPVQHVFNRILSEEV